MLHIEHDVFSVRCMYAAFPTLFYFLTVSSIGGKKYHSFLHSSFESLKSIFLSICQSDPCSDNHSIAMLRKKQTDKKHRTDRTWLLIVLALLGSALSMGAIGILLVYFNNRPIFDWNGVTLNSIIAVFSAIFKAMLAYTLSECLGQAKWIWFSSQQRSLSDIDLIDSVSRGPLGGFKIMTEPAARTFIGMGAIMVILSTTTDFFIQLTIGQKGGLEFANNTNVQIAYAKRYNRDFQIESGFTGISSVIGLGMRSAVLEGLNQPDSWISQQIQHSCPSGNCTWDTFTSLAICGDCHDITNRVEKTVHGTYRLPNGLFMYENFDMPMLAYSTPDRKKTVSFTSFDTFIWSMTIMNFTFKEERANPDNVSAMECGLWFGVNSYKSAVKNGIITEIIQPASSEIKIGSWQPFRKDKHDSGVYLGNPNGSWEGHPNEIYTPRRTDLQLGEGFNISQSAVYSILHLLGDTFIAPKKDSADSDIHNAQVYRSRIIPRGPNEYDPPAMENLFKSQDLAATFATLAKSMTNNIRQNSDGHTVMNGKEGKYVILIRTRRWFLILPVVLVIGCTVFLAMVFCHTHKSRMEFWGTNALPIVVLGAKMGPVFDDNDMRARSMTQDARRHLVQFPTIPRHGFDSIDASNPSVTQNPLTGRASITSSTRIFNIIQNRSADIEGIAPLSRISVIPSSLTDMDNTVSSPLALGNSAMQNPSSDAASIAPSTDTSMLPSPLTEVDVVVASPSSFIFQ